MQSTPTGNKASRTAHWPTPEAAASREPGPTVQWRSWHLHIGSMARSAHDRVVTEVIGPAADLFPDHPWFFIRYWQNGPHLRLRLGGLTTSETARTERLLQDRLGRAVRLQDGEEPVDRDTYLGHARRLSALEEPHRSVRLAGPRDPGVYQDTYVPETERYGGPALMPATERLFQLSSELVRAFLPRLPDSRSRSAMALRAAMSAGTALGGPADQALFYARGLDAWRQMVGAGFRLSTEQLDRLCGTGRAAPPAVDPAQHGLFGPWHTLLYDLAGQVRTEGTAEHPGEVFFSHVHMLHNRLGLTMAEELQTYARLVHLFPQPGTADAVPQPVPKEH
ncbi:thiopeptide-type bacteriocin biosynthesis protein [Streptomyces brevispora]|uniref:Thiopeptide-type bacteriocin biosynthesis protein n=1 Tax=Streptomyces brevispora TaxID=887462 RepID=A0A561V3V6_9ACTN|nr:thiopeptide-type bacteriocin biosynthesis protein [Streptomyces brevispora]TWG06288.1 thiopeptide-type bacteriocin biosynthesis protein [Streptomyces brevispora]WSC12758.1 thiopeptide-type bacteriocin biosynthesis protein [Streptomyces brevispora]